MKRNELSNAMRSGIEIELQKQISRIDGQRMTPLHEMLTYHMGWTGRDAGSEAQGKRIRPLLLLLSYASCGSDWTSALPAAASVELVHNFSLVHDDIQDNSAKRRGRDTLWVKWGIPQGINTGDALFVLSNQAILDLATTFPVNIVFQAAKILYSACLELTKGQFLDISFEQHLNLSIEDYWEMVNGKTAALLAACCEIGPLLSGVDKSTQEAFRSFGHYLGLAFQVQDDLLGIWGNSLTTGKSIASDLISMKKTLPVLFGLGKKGLFAKRWASGEISPDEVAQLARQLESEGARLYTQQIADQLTDLALQSLRLADPQGEAGEGLFELVNNLLHRDA